jgi:hypothetical protein
MGTAANVVAQGNTRISYDASGKELMRWEVASPEEQSRILARNDGPPIRRTEQLENGPTSSNVGGVDSGIHTSASQQALHPEKFSSSMSFEQQVAADRYKADKIMERNGVATEVVNARIKQYENQPVEKVLTPVEAERVRLAEKYQNVDKNGNVTGPYIARNRELQTTNIAEKLKPIANNLPNEAYYQAYTGPRPGPGDPLGIGAAMASSPGYIDRNKASYVNYPTAWGGGQFAVKQQEAINKGYTGYMTFATKGQKYDSGGYGGGMVGELKPEAAGRVGLDRLFEKVATKNEEGRTGKSITQRNLQVKGDIPASELAKIPANLKVEVAKGSTMVAGSFKYDEKTGGATWLETKPDLMDKFRESAEGKKDQFAISTPTKSTGVFTGEPQESSIFTGIPKPVSLDNMSYDVTPEVYNSPKYQASLKAEIASFGGTVPEGFKVTDYVPTATGAKYNIEPDMTEYDSGLNAAVDQFRSKSSLRDYFVMPVIEGITSKLREAEVNKRVETANAKTDVDKKAAQIKYAQEVSFIENPLGVKVTVEDTTNMKDMGYKYAKSTDIFGSQKEALSRLYYGDIPYVDVELSPAASGAVYIGGGIASTFAPVLKAPSTLAKGWAAATGAGEYLGFVGAQNKITEVTGSPTLGMMAGLGAASLVKGVSSVTREAAATRAAKQATEINPGRIQVGKTSLEYQTGKVGESTTGMKPVYVGYGDTLKPTAMPELAQKLVSKDGNVVVGTAGGRIALSTGEKVGVPAKGSIGGEIPLRTINKDVFGYTSIGEVTPSEFSRLKSTDAGFGGSLKSGEANWLRKATPSQRAIQDVIDTYHKPATGEVRVEATQLDKLNRGSEGIGDALGVKREVSKQKYVGVSDVGGKQVATTYEGVLKEGVSDVVKENAGVPQDMLHTKFEPNFGGEFQSPEIKIEDNFGEEGFYTLGRANAKEIKFNVEGIQNAAKTKGVSVDSITERVGKHEFQHVLDKQSGIDKLYPGYNAEGTFMNEIRARAAEVSNKDLIVDAADVTLGITQHPTDIGVWKGNLNYLKDLAINGKKAYLSDRYNQWASSYNLPEMGIKEFSTQYDRAMAIDDAFNRVSERPEYKNIGVQTAGKGRRVYGFYSDIYRPGMKTNIAGEELRGTGTSLGSTIKYYDLKAIAKSDTFGSQAREAPQLLEMHTTKSTLMSVDKQSATGRENVRGQFSTVVKDKGFAKPGRVILKFDFQQPYQEKFISETTGDKLEGANVVVEPVKGSGKTIDIKLDDIAEKSRKQFSDRRVSSSGEQEQILKQEKKQNIRRQSRAQTQARNLVMADVYKTTFENSRYVTGGSRMIIPSLATTSKQGTPITQQLAKVASLQQSRVGDQQSIYAGQEPSSISKTVVAQTQQELQKYGQSFAKQTPVSDTTSKQIQRQSYLSKQTQTNTGDVLIPKDIFNIPKTPGGGGGGGGGGTTGFPTGSSPPAGGGGGGRRWRGFSKSSVLKINPIASGRELADSWSKPRESIDKLVKKLKMPKFKLKKFGGKR